MTTDRDELMALIKRQPPMSSERIRQEILEAFGGDFAAMARDAMTRQRRSGHKIVTRASKKPQPRPDQ